MNTLAKQLDIASVSAIFSKNGVRKAFLFGSYAKGFPSETSDVDLLVEFESGETPDLFQFIGIKHELEQKLGKPVDLVMRSALDKYLRDEILLSAKEVYVR